MSEQSRTALQFSVVIPSWRRPAELRRCLTALEARERRASEVLVVVRSEDAETRAAVEQAPAGLGARPVTVEIPGLVAALEAGWRAAQGDIVAFTDDDALPDPDWLARMAAHFETEPRVGAVGGRDRLSENQDPPVPSHDVGRVSWYGRRGGEHHRGAGPPASVDAVKGVNMAYRRAAIEQIGFDPRLRGVGAQRHSELTLCLAVKRAGWDVVYDPAIAVDHREGPRFDERNQRGFADLGELRDAAHNELYAMLRWLPWWRKPIVLLYALLVGTREAPGLVIAIERLGREPLSRLRAATSGRLRAVGTVLRALRG